MAQNEISIINYDFNWEIEDFVADKCPVKYSEKFWPLKRPAFRHNPSFKILCQKDIYGYLFEKKITKFYLITDGVLPKDFRVQFKMVIRSVSSGSMEYSSNETHYLEHGVNLLLCTVVTKGATLRVSDKVIGFSHEHDFIAMKFHFKIFIDPVTPKQTITRARKVPCIKRCNLCWDFKNLYDSKVMADVTITVDGVSLLAHKLVLVTHSPVFAGMFDNDCLESNTKTIQITDVDASVFHNFLKCLYCSEIGDKSYDMVRDLYMLADKYAVDCLKEDCRDILEAELNEGTVFQLLEMSHLFKDETLSEKAVEFIKQNFSAVSKKPEWLKICKDHPEMASDVLREVTLFLDNKSKSN